MDREKVIKGSECLIQMTSCVGCPYWDSGKTREECLLYIGKDMLALLKEQEPKQVNDIAQQISCFSGICPSCGKMLNTTCNKNFCGECGKAVKWE